MIKNELQLRVTQGKLQRLYDALSQLNARKPKDAFHDTHKSSVKSLINDMEREVGEYNTLWGSLPPNQQVKLEAPLEELGLMLIRLRIARGISQKELAQRMGVRPQQVQQDEENEYHSLTVGRLKRILEALEVKAEVRLAA